jgi:hypothetical protein
VFPFDLVRVLAAPVHHPSQASSFSFLLEVMRREWFGSFQLGWAAGLAPKFDFWVWLA